MTESLAFLFVCWMEKGPKMDCSHSMREIEYIYFGILEIGFGQKNVLETNWFFLNVNFFNNKIKLNMVEVLQ